MTIFPRNPHRAVVVAASCCCLQAMAAPTDPGGFIAHVIPAGSQRLVGVSLGSFKSFGGTVSGVSVTGLTASSALPPGFFGASDSGFLTVRAGAFAGLAMTVTSVSGNELTLQRSPVGLISPGDTLELFVNHTIGDLFGAQNSVGLLAGTDASQADTIGLWNAETQSSRVFYYRTGDGWRESGNEAAGDQSRMPMPFPAALVINRRGSTPLQVTIMGAVPMPMTPRYFEVSSGRNLVSAPFTWANKIADYGLYLEGSPYSVIGADAAPDADTIRFSNFSSATNSEVIYYRLGQGWRTAGAEGDAGNTPVELGQSMDFQRRGPAGFIKAHGFPLQAGAALGARSASAPVTTVPIQGTKPGAGGVQVEWTAEAGATYQVQTQLAGDDAWVDLGESVTTEGTDGSAFCRPSGQGLLRIVKH
ncbi:hypothetical protein OKA05_06630 [Luteolibacter arcticus]|uniref:Uncharacterized protein n=1 Tax=Luteolibacter arcticus TaxID=1581411 RepID=A0ABT3GFI4_9BACT|nr:hypothetical protein [Luteolibacter arcticus]MCW1922221.1 hypothetical protein [Luteolibacter arcticus]